MCLEGFAPKSDRLACWAEANCMKCIKTECLVLNFVTITPGNATGLGRVVGKMHGRKR